MINHHFTDHQFISLISGFVFLVTAIFFHLKEKEKLTLFLLLLSALSIFCFASLLDPFLNIYDERFHALVAKNMMDHPFKPTLYDDPIVDMPYDRWDRYHIWLHKQPLFLWQIALSFKLFGISEFNLRIPNIIMGVALVYAGYRVGKLLVSARAGFITGILIISSFFHLELLSGRQAVDHNDFAFLVYVSLSIWAFVEYLASKQRKWIFLIGLFSGFAILCKWLAGLIIYFGWFLFKIMDKKFKPREYKDFLVSITVTFLIAAPWQVFTFIVYPEEALAAQNFNVQHILVPLDGHDGSFLYHFTEFKELYGMITAILILPAFIVFHYKLNKKILFIPLLGMVAITYLFFSFVKTKMPAFPIIVTILIYLPLAALFDFTIDLIGQLKVRNWMHLSVTGLVILMLFILRFNVTLIIEKHSLKKEQNTYSKMLLHNKKIFQTLNLPANTVLFNVKGQHYIESMFYTGLPSYRIIPSQEQIVDLKKKGRLVVIFKSSDKLPDYILADLSIIIINEEIQGYE